MQVLSRILRTIAIRTTGGDRKQQQADHRPLPEFQGFGEGILSRVPQWWWGSTGERILGLLYNEREALQGKR